MNGPARPAPSETAAAHALEREVDDPRETLATALPRADWRVNVNRIHQLYQLKGLQMRLKPLRRRVMAKLRDDRSTVTGPNQIWAMA